MTILDRPAAFAVCALVRRLPAACRKAVQAL
jgi:hypothetical protein